MSKHCLVPIILCTTFTSIKIYAFDPFTVLTIASSGANLLNSTKGITESVGELNQFSDVLGLASETLEESTGLAGDLGYESNSAELDSKVQKLELVNNKLKELKWNSEDLKYTLDSDINNTKSLSQKIHQMRKIISISRKLAGTFGLKTKGSDKVATLQQVKINSMMLDELQAMRKIQLLGYLEDKERVANQDIYLNKILIEENGKSLNRRKN